MLLLSDPAPVAAASEPAWAQYTSGDSGFRLSYPSELVTGRASADGRSCEFHTGDGAFSVTTEAGYFVGEDESLDARWRFELKGLGSSVKVRRKGRTWYVLAGATSDGAAYYYKFWARGRAWVSLRIIYPHAEAAKYAGWVPRIQAGFVAFPIDASWVPRIETGVVTRPKRGGTAKQGW